MVETIYQGLRMPETLKTEIKTLAVKKLSNSSQVMREALQIGIRELKKQTN